MPQLPTGTVTFLFSDIEGSTRLASALGTGWPPILDRHHAIIRAAVEQLDGSLVSTEGDGAFAVFSSPRAAVESAVAIQHALAAEPWPDGVAIRVRIGVHSGEALPSAEGYAGVAVHRAARIAAAGSGGQTVLSDATRALLADALPEGVRIRNLGAHRLKDLHEPQPLHDLVIEGLPSSFPRLRTSAETVSHLPGQLTRFLGRGREVAEITALLRDARLLTLTGPGGTGKTRLALEVAARIADDFDGGAHFVDLSPVDDPVLVPPMIADQLELPDRGGRDPMAALAERLARGQTLLVLDNFEQVMGAATVVRDLLAAAPGLTVLATTRSALRVYGEREYAVPPLGVPDPRRLPPIDVLSQFEAVALFIDRATAVRPDFAVTNENAPAVAEICVRLDGLPLAIELAAARIRVLNPQAILGRLEHRLGLLSGGSRDLPARQQTLRGAIAWSHDMLDDEERLLFASLSVFVGGATLTAIESLCREGSSADVFDTVASLVDKSLVRQRDGIGDEPRYEMLETIREFATEQLAASGRGAALQQQHADLYAQHANEARDQLTGPDSRRWLDRLQIEHGNLHAALGWAEGDGQIESGLRILAGAWRFWQRRGYLVEGLGHAQRLIARTDNSVEPGLMLLALEAAGGLAYWTGDQALAATWYDRWIELARATGDRASEAAALYSRSFAYFFSEEGPQHSAELAHAALERSLAISTELGDRHGMAQALWALANAAFEIRRPREARAYALQALEQLEGSDDVFLTGWASFTVGSSYLMESKPAEAMDWLKRGLRLFIDAGDVTGYELTFDAFAMALDALGDRDKAAWFGGAVASLERTSGTGLNSRNRQFVGWDPASLQGDPALAEHWQAGEHAAIEELIDAALAL
ncbi:MAG: adenylate/guanylate cyclase domain-containing protein [Chloroflexota bacterium]